MTGNKKVYDLICSLGGNCAVAHNLLYRNMRFFSLPFDWTYMENVQPVKYLSSAFKNNFQDFFLQKNLVRINGTKDHKIIYKDEISGYYFPNHFTKEISDTAEYEAVNNKMKRRIQRLQDKIQSAENILFCLCTSFEFDVSCIEDLKYTLNKLYPNKNIDFKIIQFNSSKDSEIKKDNICINTYIRKMNNYDFTKINYEWSFLDNCQMLSHSPNKYKQFIKFLSFKTRSKHFKLGLFWENIK